MKAHSRKGYKSVSTEYIFVLCAPASEFKDVQDEWKQFLESHDRSFSADSYDASQESIGVLPSATYDFFWNQNKACAVRTELYLNCLEEGEKYFYPELDDETEGVLLKLRIYDHTHPGVGGAPDWIMNTLKGFSYPNYLKHEHIEYYPTVDPHS